MKKRKLLKKFPQLSLLSFVAACSENSSEGLASFAEGFDSKNNEDDNRDADSNVMNGGPPPLSFEAGALSKGESGFTATENGDKTSLEIEIEKANTDTATLTFADATQIIAFGGGEITATTDIYKLTTTLNQYDLVVLAPNNNKDPSSDDHQKGSIFIFWNVEGIKNETIGGASTTTTNKRLEIKGASVNGGIGINAPEFLQIAGKTGDQKYDMIIGSHLADKSSKGEDAGAIYILWDVESYYESGKTRSFDLSDAGLRLDTGATAGSLTIYGVKADDNIGIHAPDFLQLGGKEGEKKLDMVIRSHEIDGNGQIDAGAIYILWDVEDYYSTDNAKKNTTIDLADRLTITAKGLGIFGGSLDDKIGAYAPDFLQIGGKEGEKKLDMIIRSEEINKSSINEGAIYILWDVADYKGETLKTIDLGKLDDAADPSANIGATAGSLAIYGAIADDKIGIHAPELLQLGGKEGEKKLDMVIRSHEIDANGKIDAGTIYILWDVEDYYGTGSDKHKIINFSNISTITAKGLGIFGRSPDDKIGIHAPEFLQIAGTGNKYDMIIRSHEVNKSSINEGAIYVLWDVEDYYGTGSDSTGVDFGAVDGEELYATSGLLTIYGAYATPQSAMYEGLGSDANNVLYDTDAAGNKILTNIDGDLANGGTKDIAFQDKDYTYVLFGDKIANDADGGGKVDSKTIDLLAIETALSAGREGYFNYNFDPNGLGSATASTKTDRVGYRFDGRKSLTEVKNELSGDSSPLSSESDVDFSAWDIA